MTFAVSKTVSVAFVVLALAHPLARASQTNPSPLPLAITVPAAAPLPVANPATAQASRIEVSTTLTIPVRSGAPNSGPESVAGLESGHKTSGTILATLVLMCAIAIRRHRSGKR